MPLNHRQTVIIDTLRLNGHVEVEPLARQMGVTTQTVRRDLAEICARGLATRTHGGARRIASTATVGYEERRLKNSAAKQGIAARAAEIIPNGASVILNIGTTTEHVAGALKLHRDLTIISNNINVIHDLRGARAKSLVLVGGTVRPSDGAIIGEEAVEQITRYKADFAVIGASALDIDGSVLDFDPREVAVARAILANARTKILVADVSKFEVRAPVRICAAADLDYVVMDRPPPPDFADALTRGGATLSLPESANEHA